MIKGLISFASLGRKEDDRDNKIVATCYKVEQNIPKHIPKSRLNQLLTQFSVTIPISI